jgi:hypothetical protein
MMNKPMARKSKMKMSNLLLLGIFVMSGVLFCSFVVSINSKVSKDEVTYANRDKSMYNRHRFDGGKTVVVQNVDDCVVILSDSVSMEIHKDDEDKFAYSVLSDSVKITQNSPTKNKVFIYLPSGSRLVANSSGVTIKGSLFNHDSKASYDVALHDSKLFVSAAKLHTFLDRLNVSGSGEDEITIDDFVHIRTLEIKNVANVNVAQAWQIENFKTAFVSSSEMTKAGDSLLIKAE